MERRAALDEDNICRMNEVWGLAARLRGWVLCPKVRRGIGRIRGGGNPIIMMYDEKCMKVNYDTHSRHIVRAVLSAPKGEPGELLV